MGLNFNDVRGLVEWRGKNTGGSVVTLGRLNLALHPSDLEYLRKTLSDSSCALAWIDRYKWSDFADDFFREVLGFDAIQSIDFSAYEGASIVHDIGTPLPHELEGQFDLAIDGGTLEHVFNFPVAAANLMKLVRVSGAVYMQSPCNNMAGHGFYQFSPELMYRIFSNDNGFEPIFVRLAIARNPSIEQTTNQPVYEVIDPKLRGGRVALLSSTPVVMMTLAKRTAEVQPFTNAVLQSDYLKKWEGNAATPALNWKGKLVDRLRGGGVPKWFARLSRRKDIKAASISNGLNYRRVW